MELNELAGAPLHGLPTLFFDIECAQQYEKIDFCNLMIHYWGRLELGAKPGFSLIIKADDKNITLYCQEEFIALDSIDNDIFIEVIKYKVSYSQLLEISNAKNVKVRMLGKHRDIERHFNKQNFSSLRSFIDQCIAELQRKSM